MSFGKSIVVFCLINICLFASAASEKVGNYLILLPEHSISATNNETRTDHLKYHPKHYDDDNNKLQKQQKSKKAQLTEQLMRLQAYKIRYANDMTPYKGQHQQQIKEILKQSKLHKPSVFEYENPTDKIIGVAHNAKEAKALAQSPIAVFYLKAGKTLKQNLTIWANSQGYQLVWDSKNDLNIRYSSVIYGTLLADKGALYQVLSSTADTSMPLQAQMMKNKVIVIKPYSYSPKILAP
ncbi:TcpQ domain-containing protein [Facilibium subflavum]|uniref:TcpQ domain-containing protein n=1 Tax=Facilibium subflavum TaxID=2219058 RepID=UPI000E655AE9|nr:TcpQ domain-containing protein [Facilibium subflavum]